MRSASSNSAGAVYLDRAARVQAVREAAARAADADPSVVRILLFGSLATGSPTPRSDADVFVEVAKSEHALSRDRIPDLLRALSPLPCPMDLFVATSEEVARLRAEGSSFLAMIERTGVELYRR